MADKIRVGLIGTGKIGPAYVKGCHHFASVLDLVACSDLDLQKAQAFADEHDLIAMTTDEMLASPEIDLIVNLTIPSVHAQISIAGLEAGKHVYSEKPLATDTVSGKRILQAATKNNKRIGCAPDTFLGGGIQTSIKLLNEGVIGEPVAATAFFSNHGPEAWHPNPGFFYQFGGGPLFDVGPYYLTTLITMLGAVNRVSASSRRSFQERLAGTGDRLPVDVNTHFSGTLDFDSGVIATVIASFDVWAQNLPRIEIYGSEGSLSVPDPNIFGGTVRVFTTKSGTWEDVPLTHSDMVSRGIGVADMAFAIDSGRAHRASGELAYHVLEVMEAFDKSSGSNQHITIESTVERPAPLPIELLEGQLDI